MILHSGVITTDAGETVAFVVVKGYGATKACVDVYERPTAEEFRSLRAEAFDEMVELSSEVQRSSGTDRRNPFGADRAQRPRERVRACDRRQRWMQLSQRTR